MKSERIPLFPLELVLLPGMTLPLHIFEPRYQLMVSRCLEKHMVFGVVLSQKDDIVAVGCAAEIVKVVKSYEDGRSDILAVGRCLFRILELFEDQPYLTGAVEYLEDRVQTATPSTIRELLNLYYKCHKVLFGQQPAAIDADVESLLSYRIASDLPLDLETKQELLELRTETERQEHMIRRLTDWLPQIVRADHVRTKAGGNGHGLA